MSVKYCLVKLNNKLMLGFQENKFFFPCYAIKDQTIPVCSMRFTEEIN